MKYGHVKRTLDIVVSTVMILITFPLFIITAIAIKLDSPGPVYYVQNRLGLGGRIFRILKFRSMKIGTPDVSTDLLLNPDAYTTRVGKFLRDTSLDEYPQLINILLGSMSFVGPRPSLFNQYELNNERMNKGIMAIRPGLTGYAQVNGRDFISDSQKLAFDLYYVKHVSFWLDFTIICSTFSQVIKGENIRK